MSTVLLVNATIIISTKIAPIIKVPFHGMNYLLVLNNV